MVKASASGCVHPAILFVRLANTGPVRMEYEQIVITTDDVRGSSTDRDLEKLDTNRNGLCCHDFTSPCRSDPARTRPILVGAPCRVKGAVVGSTRPGQEA